MERKGRRAQLVKERERWFWVLVISVLFPERSCDSLTGVMVMRQPQAPRSGIPLSSALLRRLIPCIAGDRLAA